jgi:hypothetical protein
MQVELALTIGVGSLNDTPDLKGLSNITWKAIQRALKVRYRRIYLSDDFEG